MTATSAPRVAILRKADGMLTWRVDLARALVDLGAVVCEQSFRPADVAEWLLHRRDPRRRLLLNPLTCRRLGHRMRGFAPDLVLVLNYPGITEMAADAIRGALRPGVPVAGWTCDHVMSMPDGCLPVFDRVYYFDSASLPVLKEAYAGSAARLAYLPLAACPRRYPCPPECFGRRVPRMVFAGNCTAERREFFATCREAGIPLDLYGPRAGNFPAVWRNRKLSSAALGRLYRLHLASLNLRQRGNTEHGLNLRAFEIPCAGGLGTYPEVPDVVRCFEPGREILTYRTVAELAVAFRRLLEDPEEAAAIARAGHRRALAEHTFHHRARQILADCLGFTAP